MGFSQQWDQRYAANTHMSIWPWSDVVSLVHRHCRQLIGSQGVSVLELGCGAGANIPLFLTLGFEYFAIEGSPSIVKQLHDRYPQLKPNIVVGDFTEDQPIEGKFDLVLDRASITHNNTSGIEAALRYVLGALKPNGIYIGSDWFSTRHTDFSTGEPIDDVYTRANYVDGQFVGVGKVHFSDEAHLRMLFSELEILFLEEKISTRYEPQDNHLFASWNLVARPKSA